MASSLSFAAAALEMGILLASLIPMGFFQYWTSWDCWLLWDILAVGLESGQGVGYRVSQAAFTLVAKEN